MDRETILGRVRHWRREWDAVVNTYVEVWRESGSAERWKLPYSVISDSSDIPQTLVDDDGNVAFKLETNLIVTYPPITKVVWIRSLKDARALINALVDFCEVEQDEREETYTSP